MHIKNRNLFRINRIILLKLPWLLRFFDILRKPSKRLLIIKTDAIGDYILFRNFIEVVKTSALYKDYHIDLLGNILWRDIAITYDTPFIDEFIFIKAGDLYDAPLKTLKLGWRLFRKNYQIVLQPTYARTLINDSLAALTGTKQIIGFEGDDNQIPERYKVKTDKFYMKRLMLPLNIYFEFERSKFFFETILNCPISLKAPFIKVNETTKSGIVIFPGAGVFKRGWEKEKFLALIQLILQHSSQPVYLVGGPTEVQTGNYLMKHLPQGVSNLIGKTSLPQLIDIIGNSSLLIANETSAIHIAAATKTKSVCILGGGNFERFSPYPLNYDMQPVCVYEKMECYNCNWTCIFKTEEYQTFPCISNVSLANVWQAILPLL
jgi:ADP-heptose:LPS heptosyltransferase